MKQYIIQYRAKRNKSGLIHQALIQAGDIWQARALAKAELPKSYTIIDVKQKK